MATSGSLTDTVLVIDDEESVLNSIQSTLTNAGYDVEIASSAEAALALCNKQGFDIILCDVQMPKLDGLGLVKELRSRQVSSTLVLMSAYGSAQTAVDAIRHGAADYIAKPFNSAELLLTLKKVKARWHLLHDHQSTRGTISKSISYPSIVGKNPAMSEILETISRVSEHKTTVMIYGESGTGKELFARAIHNNSPRKNKPFIAVNCAAIPANLLESELFGHKKGAFTDATRDKKGLFEEAEAGTLFLDEVGELPLHLQVKLLRVLQENEIRPVGDSRVIPIDVRIVAATLRDLEQDAIEGRFRDDLFYRLNVVSIRIPPLRARKDDIPILVNHLIVKLQEKLNLPVHGIEKAALAHLLEHSWPGNVRELENCIERAMILTDGEKISLDSLPKTVRGTTPQISISPIADDELSIKVHTRALEETLIRRALEKTGGNRTHAAKLLEISHRTLLYKLKEYHLSEGTGDTGERSE